MDQASTGAGPGGPDRETGLESHPRLLPAEAFDDRVPNAAAAPAQEDRIEGVFASRCAGMKDPRSAGDLRSALASEQGLRERERRAVRVWLAENTTAELVRAYADGLYSMQALVRAMHALGCWGHARSGAGARHQHPLQGGVDLETRPGRSGGPDACSAPAPEVLTLPEHNARLMCRGGEHGTAVVLTGGAVLGTRLDSLMRKLCGRRTLTADNQIVYEFEEERST